MQKDLFCEILRVSFPDTKRIVLKRKVTVSDVSDCTLPLVPGGDEYSDSIFPLFPSTVTGG